MKAMLIVAALLVSSVASAADGPKKPSLCAEFSFLEIKGKRAAMCTEGKPRIHETWSIVEVDHPAGGKARYLLGF